MVVAPGLSNIDLAGLRPDSVHGLPRQHPDRRPKPVARRELGGHFDAAVFDGWAITGREAAGFDGVDDGAVGGVGGDQAVCDDVGRAGSIGGEVDDAVFLNELGVLEGGFDDEHAVLGEDVLVGDGGLFELAVAEAANFSFFRPDILVQPTGEVVVENGAIFVVDDCAEAIVDQEAGDGKADEETNQGNDCDPFLTGIFVACPWFLDFAFLYSSRMKVSL